MPLNGASGEATLSFQSNKALTVTLSDGATLGTVTQSGNNYSYPVTITSGTESVTITFTTSNSSNARLDDIKFFQGQGKKAAGLSWGTASREVTIGADDNVFPTLTNANNLEVTYSSDNTDVATIAADGTITLVAAGKANISAAFAGNDEYDAQTVSYALTVKAQPTVDISNTPETAYTVEKAIELINAGEGLDTKVYVTGTIKSITEISTQYGNATYDITDGTNDLTIYRGYGLGNSKFSTEDAIKTGDVVIIYGKLVVYNGTKEMATGNYIYSLNGSTPISQLKAQSSQISNGKFIQNSRLVIVSGNKKFNVAGQTVK